MKLREIKMAQHYVGYDIGAEPGIRCTVELQIGERYSAATTITLTDEQCEKVARLAVELAIKQLNLGEIEIDVKGKPGTPRPKAEITEEAAPRLADDPS